MNPAVDDGRITAGTAGYGKNHRRRRGITPYALNFTLRRNGSALIDTTQAQAVLMIQSGMLLLSHSPEGQVCQAYEQRVRLVRCVRSEVGGGR